VFSVQLSSPSALSVQVIYTTEDDTARAPLDYRASSGVLRFPAGITNQSISVQIRGDQRYEPEERFFLRLFQAQVSVLDRTQAVARIIDDDANEVDFFEWNPVPSPQFAGFPFSAMLTARDGLGRVAANYMGQVSLTAAAESREIVVGTETNGWTAPLGAFFHDQRTQVLLPAAELGGAGTLNAITLDVIRAPAQTLSNWTIRLKNTVALSQAGLGWEAEGWIVVYQRDESILEPGPITFFLTTPFAYDGTNSLLIDFSFNNGSYSTDALVRSSEAGVPLTLTLQTDSAFGDPLSWVGLTPPPTRGTRVPNLHLQFERPLPVLPSRPIELEAGVWSGPVTVVDQGRRVALRANDGLGRSADSSAFEVLSGRDTNADGTPDAWESAHFGAVGTPSSRAGADPDGDGLSNLDEFHAGTDPRKAENVLSIVASVVRDGTLQLRFGTVRDRRYWIEQRLADGSNRWLEVYGPVAGTGQEVTATLLIDRAESGSFLRVRVAP